MINWIIIGIIAAAIILSIHYTIKRKKEGKLDCGCNCSGCSSNICHFKSDKEK